MANSDSSFLVQDLFNVKDRVVLVTGGGTGIGLVMARALAQNGAHVYIASRRQEVLDKVVSEHGQNLPPGGSITGKVLDVTDKASIKKVVDEIGEKEGHLDVLINNSGITSVKARLDKGGLDKTNKDLDADWAGKEMWESQEFGDWDENWRTNASSIYFVTAACVPWLAKAAKIKRPFWPVVLNIASISGHTKLTQQGQLCYNTVKAATIHVSKQLAQELSRTALSIRVNSISPGYFHSQMSREPDLKAQQYNVPLARGGTEQEMAQLVIAMVVNEYQTGVDVVIDGGLLLTNP